MMMFSLSTDMRSRKDSRRKDQHCAKYLPYKRGLKCMLLVLHRTDCNREAGLTCLSHADTRACLTFDKRFSARRNQAICRMDLRRETIVNEKSSRIEKDVGILPNELSPHENLVATFERRLRIVQGHAVRKRRASLIDSRFERKSPVEDPQSTRCGTSARVVRKSEGSLSLKR